ncbi:MFS transporter [Pseudonocardia eucalypti]|uniref:MFS transporter n=1 Tax=Pseudonocardia eucalypti TaxID=648755 RepID=A0ABP9QQM8_9PSEU|nr:MFS family permease [Pseudonocardia eucalypti]
MATHPHRWSALAVVSLAQLMIALDATVMNVALPSVQHALGLSDGDRQWVITAYTLAFGGLLLLGGRLTDRLGQARAFLAGLAGFAAASAAGGLATGLVPLALARAAQGASAALLAPSALALVSVTFTAPRDRAKAFALFGAIAGSGGAVGLLLGGVLVGQLGWRACLFVTVPVAVVAALGTRYLPSGPPFRPRMAPGGPGAGLDPPGVGLDRPGAGSDPPGAGLDLPGAALVTAGLAGLVAGCSGAAGQGWASGWTLGPLGAGLALIALFGWCEARAARPLLPPRLLADRARVGACLAVAFAVAGMLGVFLFLSYYLQVVLGYSPVRTGLAFLPLSLAVFGSAQLVAARLLPRCPARALIVPGLLAAAAAMGLLTRLTPESGYASLVLPAEILLGVGLGCVFTPAISSATARVDRADAGIAAAVVNTAQQVGGSVGLALLNTVAAGAAAGYPAARTVALVHGYTTAAAVAAGLLLAGAALAAFLITTSTGGNP